MRVWAEVYDENGVKTGSGPVTAIQSASITEQLDGAGSFSLDLGTDERVLLQLVNEAEVRLMVQTFDDMPPEEWGRGIIRDNDISDAEGGTSVRVSGPDTLDTLTERTVGIGRSYDTERLDAIIADLVSIVPGWTESVDSTIAGDLQSSRFDGVNVLQALVRTVEEKGCHFRRGANPNTIEVGPFGDYALSPTGSRVRAIKAPSVIGNELYGNDAVLLIDKISQSQKSAAVVNWCIPIGAGTGSAALTLRDTTYAIYNADGTLYRAGTASKYPIYRRVNGSGIVEYYMDASGGARQRQAVVTFKAIGAIANSILAKQAAADMLVQATTAYLDRAKVPLVTYRFSAKNVQADIRPGHLLPVQYTGRLDVLDETRTRSPRITYMSVDTNMWVMKVTRKIGDGQITHDFEVATIDRYVMDSTRIVVSLMEAMQVQDLSVQSVPFMSERSSKDFVGWDVLRIQQRPARFTFKIDSKVTDLIQVSIRFTSRPLSATTRVQDSSVTPFLVVYEAIEGDQHPKGIQLWINGVDRSSAFGGPWNNRLSGTPGVGWTAGQYENNALDVTCDITSYILAAASIYQDHVIEFYGNADRNAFTYKVPGQGSATNLLGDATSGEIECNFLVFGTARGIVPEPTS